MEEAKPLASICKRWTANLPILTAYTKALCKRWYFVQRTISYISHLFQPLEEVIRAKWAERGLNVIQLCSACPVELNISLHMKINQHIRNLSSNWENTENIHFWFYDIFEYAWFFEAIKINSSNNNNSSIKKKCLDFKCFFFNQQKAQNWQKLRTSWGSVLGFQFELPAFEQVTSDLNDVMLSFQIRYNFIRNFFALKKLQWL